MGLRIPKVHKKPIPEQLGDMSIKTCDDLRTNTLIRPDDFSIFFGVELAGECGGIDEVTEHDRELTAFSFWSMRGGVWDCARSGGEFRFRFACPNQHLTVLIDSKPLDLDNLHFEVFQIGVIEGKLAFQCSI